MIRQTHYLNVDLINENRARSKRSSTIMVDDTPIPLQENMRKKFKMTTCSLDNIGITKVVADLKNANWEAILSKENAKQKATKFVNVFEKCKQLRQDINVSLALNGSPRIRKRRNAVYIPRVQVNHFLPIIDEVET